MNELAAICFSVVKQGALAGAATQGPEPLGFRLCGPAHDEADAFTLFDQLMVGAAQLAMFTHPGTSACPRQPARSPVGELPRPRREPSAAEPGPPASAILARCHRCIHDVLLKAVDGELHAHLQQLEVEPPVFLLRWLRLFFCREFELEEAVLLWDRIFADAHRTCSVSGPPYPSFGPDSAAIVREASAASSALPLVDYLAVALLVRQRGELLSGDQTDCLRRLMASARAPEQGAPSESSVEQLVEAAARLRGRLAERPYVTAEVCAPAPGRAATPEECPRRRQQLLNAVGGLFSAGRQSLARAGQRGEAALAAGAPAAGPEPAEGRGDSLAGWASDAPAATALATAPASLEVAELRRRVAAAEQERDAAQRRAAELHALRSAEWAAERAELEARLGGKDRRIAALEEELAHERRRGQRAHEPARDGASGGATAAGPSPVRATAALPAAGSKPPAGEDEVEGVVLGETFSG
ncbi:unnamed protein product [Prorocentrum cordatum]|uniref:Rab-GAP TBC domain-containing protein n=1 Tax=Prorocentrum cordatum TaxID=2364126 RepID=A0ABN9WKG6_9DINO|nr:unnamed protein product [Polarella glacialis]